eukprot:1145833-Pelagomonas_calceolata.AAC.8
MSNTAGIYQGGQSWQQCEEEAQETCQPVNAGRSSNGSLTMPGHDANLACHHPASLNLHISVPSKKKQP